MHQRLADSTFRVTAGSSSGSGFSFRSPQVVLTNHHVIEPALTSGASIHVHSEDGQSFAATLLAHSDKSKDDFAILRVSSPLPANRQFLVPQRGQPVRGTRVLFAGFPHGIPHLLVHEAIVSGAVDSRAYYIDGSVNGGNSGGPIVDASTGALVGIVTQRRFMAGDKLHGLAAQVAALATQARGMANSGGRVVMMGLDFTRFVTLVADGLQALSVVIEQNGNVGIGIGFKIDAADAECGRLAL
jgi:S1-C subfamily serine protease